MKAFKFYINGRQCGFLICDKMADKQQRPFDFCLLWDQETQTFVYHYAKIRKLEDVQIELKEFSFEELDDEILEEYFRIQKLKFDFQ